MQWKKSLVKGNAQLVCVRAHVHVRVYDISYLMGLKVYSAVVWVWAEATVNVSQCFSFYILSLSLSYSVPL